jgi:hypothetical protein
VQQEKFAPTRVTQGNYRTRGEAGSLRLVRFSCSSNNLQQLANNFVPELTMVVVRYQQLTSLQNQSKVSNKVFLIFRFKVLKVKHHKVTRELLMSKSWTKDHGFT